MAQDVKIAEASPAQEFRNQLERQSVGFVQALPPHVPPERFKRVVATAVLGNPDLLSADRQSLFEAAMKAAQDGLLPDGQEGALVVFNTKVKRGGRDETIAKVQWMPMISGILKKVRNSGELLSIAAHVAYEHDKFYYCLGDDEKIEHEPLLDGDRGEPKLVYAIAKTKDGGIYRQVMTLKQVEKVRAVSRAKDGPAWRNWWDEMAQKTVLRRLSKRLPLSADLDDLIRRDDELYDFRGQRAEQPEGVLGSRNVNPLKGPPRAVDVALAEEPDDASDDAGDGDQVREDPISTGGPRGGAAEPGAVEEPAREEARRAASAGPANRPYADDEGYVEYMRDRFQTAKGPSVIKEAWSATRVDRGELLSREQSEGLTAERDAALRAFERGGE